MTTITQSLTHHGDVLSVESRIVRTPGTALDLLLSTDCQDVEWGDADGAAVPGRRIGDTLQVEDPERTGMTRLNYEIAVSAPRVLLPERPWLARPAHGDFQVLRTDVHPIGSAGLVVGSDPRHGIPPVLAWPPGADPLLVVTIRRGEVRTRDEVIGQEVARMVDTFTGWLGPVDEVTIVDAAVPGAYAYSFPGMICVHPGMLDFPVTLTGQYLPHEICHQWFGNRVRATGAGFLWLQECLPEALQALYVRKRWGVKAYETVAVRYRRAEETQLLGELFDLEPAARAGLPLDRYHDLLAVGTHLWLSVFQAAPSTVHRIVRGLAAEVTDLSADEVVARVKAEVPLWELP